MVCQALKSFLCCLLISKALIALDCPGMIQPPGDFGGFGDSIHGSVWESLKDRKPRTLVTVQLLSSGKSAWSGSTDKHGDFNIESVSPGTYRLIVRGWGSANIKMEPQRPILLGQLWLLHLTLYGKSCSFISGSTD